MARHIGGSRRKSGLRTYQVCDCESISSQTVHEYWEALEFVVHNSFKKVSVINIPSCIGY